jgi:hypothetical protein
VAKKNDTQLKPGADAPPAATAVVEPTAQTNGNVPVASTVPAAEKKELKGAAPIMKFGPYPCPGERRAFLAVAVWKNEHVADGGEVFSMYSVALTRTYYNGPANDQPKNSSSIPANCIGLACLLLEKAEAWVKAQKSQ